jgi:hypothetical protein
MTTWFQMKKIINYKVSYIFEIYNFYFGRFSYEVIWKIKKNQFQIISTDGFLNKPPLEIHDLYMRFYSENRQWKWIFIGGFLKGTTCKNAPFSLAVLLTKLPVKIVFYWRFFSRAHQFLFTGVF